MPPFRRDDPRSGTGSVRFPHASPDWRPGAYAIGAMHSRLAGEACCRPEEGRPPVSEHRVVAALGQCGQHAGINSIPNDELWHPRDPRPAGMFRNVDNHSFVHRHGLWSNIRNARPTTKVVQNSWDFVIYDDTKKRQGNSQVDG